MWSRQVRSCTRFSVAASGRDGVRAASDAAARGNAAASSAPDRLRSLERPPKGLAACRGLTICDDRTVVGRARRLRIALPQLGVTSEGEVAMRRLAFSGESGRRLAEGETTTRRACAWFVTSSTPRVPSCVSPREGGSSGPADAGWGDVGDGLPSRPEGARSRFSSGFGRECLARGGPMRAFGFAP
jgi:hypothetical protein